MCTRRHLVQGTRRRHLVRAPTPCPAGDYAYKAAINKSWDENYGAKAVKNGGNIAVTVPAATPVTFYYDHRTHWVTSDLQNPIVTAAGSFQSELGCPAAAMLATGYPTACGPGSRTRTGTACTPTRPG